MLRALFLSLLSAPVLITFVMFFIVERTVPDEDWVVPVSAALAVMSVVVPRLVMGRKVKAGDTKAFADWYRTTFFLGFALCEAPFLIAFILCFLVDALLPILIALPGFIAGMLMIAPSRRNLSALQSRVSGAGSAVDVIAALKEAPGLGRQA